MEQQTETIAKAVKATDEIKSNLQRLDMLLWSLDVYRDLKLEYNKDIQALMFRVIKIKEKAENIRNKMHIDYGNSDYKTAYFFKDTYEAGCLINNLYEEILNLYNSCKIALELILKKADEKTN
jgi:hypothetical protein